MERPAGARSVTLQFQIDHEQTQVGYRVTLNFDTDSISVIRTDSRNSPEYEHLHVDEQELLYKVLSRSLRSVAEDISGAAQSILGFKQGALSSEEINKIYAKAERDFEQSAHN